MGKCYLSEGCSLHSNRLQAHRLQNTQAAFVTCQRDLHSHDPDVAGTQQTGPQACTSPPFPVPANRPPCVHKPSSPITSLLNFFGWSGSWDTKLFTFSAKPSICVMPAKVRASRGCVCDDDAPSDVRCGIRGRDCMMYSLADSSPAKTNMNSMHRRWCAQRVPQ